MRIDNNADFESLYRDTLPKVARIVQRMGGNLETAKDLFHDAIIIYLEKQKSNTLQIKVSDQAYIVGIAKILCARRLKDNGQYLPLEIANDGDPELPDYYEPPAAHRPVIEYLKTAGKKCLQLLQAFYYDKLSMTEIADGFRYKSQHSATVQKYKCLEKIREQVKQTDYETIAQ